MIRTGDELGVCAISVGEFFSGLAPTERPRWQRFVANLRYWDISPNAATRAGADRYALARRGIIIPITDALIAAVAREVGAIILTDNLAHFPQPDVRAQSIRT